MELADKVKRLGLLVRTRRKEMKWTLDDFEIASGVGKSYLSNIERGYIHPKRGPVVPSDETLDAIARALKIQTYELHSALGRTPPESALSTKERQWVEVLRNDAALRSIVERIPATAPPRRIDADGPLPEDARQPVNADRDDR